MDWTSILKDLGVVTIISGLITWLIKSLGDTYLKKRFTAYEKELDKKSEEFKLELDKKLESYKHELSLINLRNSKVYEKRANIIESVYEKIVSLNFAIIEMTRIFKIDKGNFEEEEKARIDKSGELFNDFIKYYKVNKLYFTEDTVKKLDKLVSIFYDIIDDYNFSRNWAMSEVGHEKIKKLYEKIEHEIPDILLNLENDFKYLMGVIN